MADQLSSNAARAKRKQDANAPQGRQRSARQRKFDQDLAALEAMLSDDLHHSPPIASNDEDDQPLAPEPGSPKARLKPPSRSRPAVKKSGEPRRARRSPPPAENFNDAPMPQVDRSDWMRAFEAELLREEDEPAFSRMHPVDLDEYAAGRTEPVFEAREPRPTPERNPLNAGERFYTKPYDRQAPITRALRIGATVFSLLALVGVSALLVLLAVGGERLSTPAVANLPANAKQTAAAEKAAPATLPVEEDDVLVTGTANGARDPSRIAPAGEPMHALRGGGTVRAVAPGETVAQPQQVAENAPALRTPDASADQSVLTAEPARTPPAENAVPATTTPESATAEPIRMASVGNARTAEPQAAVRSVPVTSHVNLRATGDNDAKVVAVVPAGKNVDVIECKQWCEVSYNDQQGFIHKRFLKE